MKANKFKQLFKRMSWLPKNSFGNVLDYVAHAVVGIVIVAATFVVGFVLMSALYTSLLVPQNINNATTTNTGNYSMTYAVNATSAIQASLYNNGVTVFGIIILVLFFVAVLFVLKSLGGKGGDGGQVDGRY